MISRRNLIDMNKKKLSGWTNNEADQAINGIEETEIVEIIDHHKLGTIETIKPVNVRNNRLDAQQQLFIRCILRMI